MTTEDFMTESQIHQERKVKNLLLLGLLLLFVVMVFAVTIIKTGPAFRKASEDSKVKKEQALVDEKK
jgi:hypothetical protein